MVRLSGFGLLRRFDFFMSLELSAFRYTHGTGAGERITGMLEADSEAAVLGARGKNLFPHFDRGQWHLGEAAQQRRRSADARRGFMYGQLADLIGSGVPLLRALDSLIRLR
jgi:type II secretory pathway component PulF